MAARIGTVVPKSTFRQLFPVDAWPVVGAVCVGLAFGAYKGIHSLSNPDVNLNPTDRGKTPWEKADTLAQAGTKWRDGVTHHYRHEDQGRLSMIEVFSPQWWRMRHAVHHEPERYTLGGKVTMQ